MPILVLDGIGSWFQDIADSIGAEVKGVLDDAASFYYDDVQSAFNSGGPGWKELSPFTVAKKILEGAPNPSKILHEWHNMRKSIEIRDESEMKLTPVKRRVKMYGTAGFAPLESTVPMNTASYKTETIGYTAYPVFCKSIGLFSDTAIPYTEDQLWGFRGARDPVSRGEKHEFGGLELQTLEFERDLPGKASAEVIRTGRMRHRALKGESEAAETDREIKKQRIGEDVNAKKEKIVVSKQVYIPERSFLRMPFDRSLNNIVGIITDGIGRLIDNA